MEASPTPSAEQPTSRELLIRAGLAVPSWKGVANSVFFLSIVALTLALLVASRREASRSSA